MTISIKCPYCQAVLKANPYMAGRTLKCPKCKNAIQIPTLPVPAAPPPAAIQTAPARQAPSGDRRRAPPVRAPATLQPPPAVASADTHGGHFAIESLNVADCLASASPAAPSTLSLKMDPSSLPGVLPWSATTTCQQFRTARLILFNTVWLVVVFTALTAVTMRSLGCVFLVVTPVLYLSAWRWLLARHDALAARCRWDHHLRMQETLVCHVSRLTVPAGSHTTGCVLPDFTIVVVNPVRFSVVDLERRDMSNPLTADVIEVVQEKRHVETRTTINSTTKSKTSWWAFGFGDRNWATAFGSAKTRSDTQTEGRETYHLDFLVTVQTRRPEVGSVLLNFGEGKESEQAANQVAGQLKAAALSGGGAAQPDGRRYP
jgi:hypothetical protein